MNWKRIASLVVAAVVSLSVFSTCAAAQQLAGPALREAMHKAKEAGNFKDAYAGFRKLALDPQTEPAKVGSDLAAAIECLNELNRTSEIDELIESTVAAHARNWRLLQAAAEAYLSVPQYGYIIAGNFERENRVGGRWVESVDRDRVRALQLMQQAMGLVEQEPAKAEASAFYLSLAGILLNGRGSSEAWRLQMLTDLAELPDYGQDSFYTSSTSLAPVDEQNNPAFHALPKSWQAAATDGERWRWALHQAAVVAPENRNRSRFELARFLHEQFGVQSVGYSGLWIGNDDEGDAQKKNSTYALHTLGENETIAHLATGIKRLTLPDEFNFIKIYQQIAAGRQSSYGEKALAQLAQIFENRRQYPKAAAVWRENIETYGAGDKNWKPDRLNQIVGNWGRFEGVMTQPAGRGATVEFVFRNGKRVAFEARAVKTAKLLEDVKAYLKSNPPKLDEERIEIEHLGYRLVQKAQAQYLGETVARWDLDLQPRPNHFDRRITITTPLQKTGAYLLTAKMADGNTSQIILWIADTAIIKKPMAGKAFYFVGDAVTGRPIAGARLDFFGCREESLGENRYQLITKTMTGVTDAGGQIIQEPGADQQDYKWIVTATAPQGRFAYLGFTSIWVDDERRAEYDEIKVFTMTDRPVYRPGQQVQFKFWVRRAQYDMGDQSQFAHQTFQIEIEDPRREKIFSQQMTADELGGLAGSFELPPTAALGVYHLNVVGRGGGSFRVEEYKKPEFEVRVEAPAEPVMLGKTIKARIEARYYFGAPVVEAKVKYKVLRKSASADWFPPMPWDWLYGRGYSWLSYDYAWYPGWGTWGCARSTPGWLISAFALPEIVAQAETPIGPDGAIEIQIDTAAAQALHPDEDHRYEIIAEVVDRSRRTIVGRGEVLVARKPFRVTTWLDRGYYRVGEVVGANFAARRLDGKPVSGKGQMALYQVTYNDKRQPVESLVREWELNADSQGNARLQFQASRPGQYRLSYKLTDAAGHTAEGGTLFTIMGEGFDGAPFRFSKIELIPDKRHYQPGGKVQLQINTDHAGSTVLLFVRPEEGVYLSPRLVRMKGKSAVVEVEVAQQDTPNFFIEAVTIADGSVYGESREIFVPPQRRVLGVEVVPSAETYNPGQKAKVRLKLTDSEGKPFAGSTVLTVYDKSLEYITGGSNVADIQDFFWKWRRYHNAATESNLNWSTDNFSPPSSVEMSDIGVFGYGVIEGLETREALWWSADPQRLQTRSSGLFATGSGYVPVFAVQDLALPVPRELALAHSVGPKVGSGAPLVEPVIRSQFADLALWKSSLTTGSDGLAEVELTMPENLTTWKIRAWSMGHGTRVGQGEAEVITRKDLIVRLQAPRFFIETDEVVLSANVHNYLGKAKQVEVALELDGSELVPLDDVVRKVDVAAGSEMRVDWRVRVAQEGETIVRVKALTDEESDAVEMSLPVYVHGMLKTESFSATLRPEDNAHKFTLRVPEERRPGQSRLEVRYSPTLAGAMVDALPYLADYPYGCTEQTLNRFLPAIITQKTILEMGLNLQEIHEKRVNLNAQEIGDDAERAAAWKRFDRNPVFSEVELAEIVQSGVARLAQMQLSDGGWGWFSGSGERSDAHTTALVVHGLQIAAQNGVMIPGEMRQQGLAWLKGYQSDQVQQLQHADRQQDGWKAKADNIDALVYMVLADAGIEIPAMRDFLYRDRVELSAYAKALFGLALVRQNDQEKLATILDNLSQFVVEDDENQTAYLNVPAGTWWHWYGSEYEAHAFYLKLLAAARPQDPIAPRLVKYLLNNRKHATWWNSTRDTAYVVEALADYLKATGENKPDLVVQVWLDGQKRKEIEIKPENLFTFDNRFVLQGRELQAGLHTLELRKRGQGALYCNAYLTNFSLEDPITAAGLELKIRRKYYRLQPVAKTIQTPSVRGQAIDQKVEKYERHELANLATLTSGDLVEIELAIESKNDYEYVVLEDMKAAGFEPINVRSGYGGNKLGAYMELRDDRVTLFLRRLARGKHSLSYRTRAEIPGKFSALPTRVSAMYAPELRGNSSEIKLKITD